MVDQLPLIIESGSVEPARPRARELAMSAAWHGGLTRTIATSDGTGIRVVFRGNWSHGFGPDFADALIQFGDGELRSGDVEIHLAASDWTQHGHDRDPRYNRVILHVVARLDFAETKREDGVLVPTVVLDVPDADLFAIDQELPDIWSTLGHSVCAEDLAHREPNRLRAAILRLGDRRFSERVTSFEGDLAVLGLPVVLVRGLFESFGYSQNREPMRMLAERLNDSGAWTRLAGSPAEVAQTRAHALLFGIAGFLPMSPADAQVALLDHAQITAIESEWRKMAPDLGSVCLPPTMWTRARTRPANHPMARLRQLANLLVNTRADPTGALFDCIRSGANPALRLRELTEAAESPGLGMARATAIAASVVLPVAMAYAHHTADMELEDTVSRAWASLPRSEWSRPARRALEQAVGGTEIGTINERAVQGLLYLDRSLCTPRSCFECPIAAEVIRDRQSQQSGGPAVIQSILPT